MLTRKNILYASIVSGLSLSFGASFDTWWHLAKGHDSLFVLPHWFIYAGTGGLLFLSLYGWKNLKDRVWEKVFLWMLLVPLAIPLDELWHYFFGKETVNSVFIVWSPPHIPLFLGPIVAPSILLVFVKREISKPIQEIFGGILLASILNLVLIFAAPFLPHGPFSILGYYGISVSAYALTYVFLYAKKILPNSLPAFFTALCVAGLGLVFSDANSAFESSAHESYPHLPNWTVLLSFVLPGITIDTLKNQSGRIMGTLSGFVYGAVLFFLSSPFVEPWLAPSTHEMLTGILFASFGGFLAGAFFPGENAEKE